VFNGIPDEMHQLILYSEPSRLLGCLRAPATRIQRRHHAVQHLRGRRLRRPGRLPRMDMRHSCHLLYSLLIQRRAQSLVALRLASHLKPTSLCPAPRRLRMMLSTTTLAAVRVNDGLLAQTTTRGQCIQAAYL
jgi:hypothetical protein